MRRPPQAPLCGPSHGGLRRGGLLVCGLLLGGTLGCGDDEGERDRPRVPTTSAPRASADEDRTHESREADPRLPPAELGLLEGTVTLADATAVSGMAIEAGQLVRLEGPGRATLELPGGARATLWSEGTVLLAVDPDRGIWIVRGVVHVAEPPTGLGQRTPRRIATPTATIELQGAGDVIVAVDAAGATQVGVLNGAVELTSTDVDARRRLRAIEVVAGLEVRVVDHLEEARPGASRLEDALASARAMIAAEPAPAPAPSPPGFTSSTHRLDEALRWLEVEERRGRDLTGRHRAAVQAGRDAEAMQYQREIVGHAQAVHALRQVVLARWERFALMARVAAPERVQAEEVAPRLDRLRNLLGS